MHARYKGFYFINYPIIHSSEESEDRVTLQLLRTQFLTKRIHWTQDEGKGRFSVKLLFIISLNKKILAFWACLLTFQNVRPYGRRQPKAREILKLFSLIRYDKKFFLVLRRIGLQVLGRFCPKLRNQLTAAHWSIKTKAVFI